MSHPRWQGPLRAAVAIFLAGALVVWLVKPIGEPCPDLERLPAGSTARSSPSLTPPGTRTCTYTAAGGTEARSSYVPWLDWIVLVLLAALVAGGIRVVSPAGRAAPRRSARVRPAAPREGRAEHDAAARERARRERAERDR